MKTQELKKKKQLHSIKQDKSITTQLICIKCQFLRCHLIGVTATSTTSLILNQMQCGKLQRIKTTEKNTQTQVAAAVVHMKKSPFGPTAAIRRAISRTGMHFHWCPSLTAPK